MPTCGVAVGGVIEYDRRRSAWGDHNEVPPFAELPFASKIVTLTANVPLEW